MPPKKNSKNIIVKETSSDSEDSLHVKKIIKKPIKKIKHNKNVNLEEGAIDNEVDDEDHIYNENETDGEIEGEGKENIEEIEEKNLEVENEDLFGDDGNEIDDEDKGLDEEPEPEVEIEGEGEGEGVDANDEGCLYKFAVKNKELDSDEEVEEEEVYDDDTKFYDMVVSSEERITKPVLFMYERVRILGTRARQLSRGAKPMLLNIEHLSPKEIARKELENKVVPFIIVRTLPNGKKEHWKLDELQIVN